jgi:hypothetical protein
LRSLYHAENSQPKLLVHWPASVYWNLHPYKSFKFCFLMAREASRERCPVCDQLEPRTNNGDSAKRAKKRRLDEKEEMDRTKKQNAPLCVRVLFPRSSCGWPRGSSRSFGNRL